MSCPKDLTPPPRPPGSSIQVVAFEILRAKKKRVLFARKGEGGRAECESFGPATQFRFLGEMIALHPPPHTHTLPTHPTHTPILGGSFISQDREDLKKKRPTHETQNLSKKHCGDANTKWRIRWQVLTKFEAANARDGGRLHFQKLTISPKETKFSPTVYTKQIRQN
jgi:hypothetical protein